MLRTYEAILEGDRLKWTRGAPPDDGTVRVHVTVVEAPQRDEPDAEEQVWVEPDPELEEILENSPDLPDQERRRTMAEALEELARVNAFADIEDSVAWQREIRKDRPLPGRA